MGRRANGWRDETDGLLLTIPAACHTLKVGHSRLYEMFARGEITAIKVGRSTRVVRASIVEYIERQIATQAPLSLSPSVAARRRKLGDEQC